MEKAKVVEDPYPVTCRVCGELVSFLHLNGQMGRWGTRNCNKCANIVHSKCGSSINKRFICFKCQK